jgi:hypothetical protein
LFTPYFMRADVPKSTSQQDKVCPGFTPGAQTFLFCVWGKIDNNNIDTGIRIANELSAKYHLDFKALPDLDNGKPGSGLGMYYITPEFAAKVQALNTTVNEGIAQAATSSHVPMVDVTAFFDGVASGDPKNPYYKRAYNINTGTCCGLAFGQGLVSFDGLHPSNTGYALLASYFIDKINSSYGTRIPQINVDAAYEGTRCNVKTHCFPDPYAPPNYIL